MLCTLVHQLYIRDVATDDSGFSNHGLPIRVATEYPGLGFEEAGSRINVRPAPSLTGLSAIRLGVRFTLAPHGKAHRYNLAEGFESFALFVNPDLSISGTILDAGGEWTGATSAPGTVVARRMHRAVLECDGVSALQLSVDGAVVAENYTVAGAVRDIGALGLAIGHWPDPPDVYTFQGTIFEVLLQKNDPRPDLFNLLDPCCADREALLSWLRCRRKNGLSLTKLLAAAAALRAASLEGTIALRVGDKDAALKQKELARAAALALRLRDCNALEQILKQWRELAAASVDEQTRVHLGDIFSSALDKFGFTAQEWSELLELLCLDPCRAKSGGRTHGCQ